MEGYGGYVFSVRVSSLDGAGDGTRTRDVQLGKTTVNRKQRTLRFQHLVLAIESTQFSLCASARLLTEHKRSTRIRKAMNHRPSAFDEVISREDLGRMPAIAPVREQAGLNFPSNSPLGTSTVWSKYSSQVVA